MTIDFDEIEGELRGIADDNDASLVLIGASNKSDSLYFLIRKPKTVSTEYGVLEDYTVHIRLSNHYNDTNTHEKLTADLSVNIFDKNDIDDNLTEIENFLQSCETEYED